MKQTTFITLLTLLAFGLPTLVKAKAKRTKKPNVIMIYTDDHRYTGIHALGGQAVRTPNIDLLANEGVVFTHAYLQGAFSGATCMPSRAMLMTGRNLFHLEGVGHNIPEEHTTMGEAFHEAGYKTHIVGKWHQDNQSLVRSFDDGDYIMGRGVYLTDHYRMPLWDWDKEAKFSKQDAYLLEYDKNGDVVRRSLTKQDKRGPIGEETLAPHTSELFADKATEYITQYDEKQPFFMYLAFHAPHDPRQAPQEYKDLYPEANIQLPPSYCAQHPFDNGHMVLRDEELAPWPRTPEVARKHLSDYYAIITHLDVQIGRVIAALKASGQYDNTIVVLAGDSGLAVGCHGLIGKQSVYDEDGIHVPFIVSGGAVETHGKRIDALCYTHDILPTTLNLAGVDIPASVQGQSMVPAIKGEINDRREYTYHAYKQYQRAYRKDGYKLIEYVRAPDNDWKRGREIRGSRVTQLFHIDSDPWETTNLAFLPAYKERLASMRAEMKEIAIKEGDVNDNLEQTASTKKVGGKNKVRSPYYFWDYLFEVE